MPQEFIIVRCFDCTVFQVHQSKKSSKWACKMCGEKQSLKKVYGRGTGAECRQLVQSLNLTSGKLEEDEKQQSWTRPSNTEQFLEEVHEHQKEVEVTPVSKWTDFIDRPSDVAKDDPQSDPEFDGGPNGSVTTERPQLGRRGRAWSSDRWETERKVRTWSTRKRQRVQAGRVASYDEDGSEIDGPESFPHDRKVTMTSSHEYSAASFSSMKGDVVESQKQDNNGRRSGAMVASKSNNNYPSLKSHCFRGQSLYEKDKAFFQVDGLEQPESDENEQYVKNEPRFARTKLSDKTNIQVKKHNVRFDTFKIQVKGSSDSEEGEQIRMKSCSEHLNKYSKVGKKSSKWSSFLYPEETGTLGEEGYLESQRVNESDKGNLVGREFKMRCEDVKSIFHVDDEIEEDLFWID